MAKRSEIHFQKGVSLHDFLQRFGTEKQCREGLLLSKWPDGLPCFNSFKNIGHLHYPIKTTGKYGSPNLSVFDWLNTVIGNVKNSITGTYHGMNHKHVPRYLGEFCF